MKKIILTFCCASLIQVSTCGNQKIISSSYSRGGKTTVIDKLCADYINEHENIEHMFDAYQKLGDDRSESHEAWTKYDRFSKKFWSEALYYSNGFDSSTKKLLVDFFNKEEKKYEQRVDPFRQVESSTTKELALMDDHMRMMKLLASHKQFTQYLTSAMPDIKDLEKYNEKLEKFNRQAKDINQTLTNTPEIVKSLK